MMIRQLFDRMAKTNRKLEHIRTAHYIAAGVGVVVFTGACVAAGIMLATKSGKELREKMKNNPMNKVDSLRDIVIEKADTVKARAADAADKIGSVIDNVQDKAVDIKNDFHDGSNDIKKDVQETAENIAEEFDKD